MAEPGRLARSFWRSLYGAVRAAAWFLRRAGLDLLRRAYAAALIALIVWLSYRSIRYLLVSLITPSDVPAQISDVPRRLDEALLHGARPDWLGLSAVENPRSPLSHYHRFDTWIQHDPPNDCTRSGCHAPLPHGRRKEVRAFLNMHATSIHCGVCHFASERSPLPLAWYELRQGRVTEPPALLSAIGWLDARLQDRAATLSADEHRAIVGWLRTAAEQSEGDPALIRAADDIHAVRPSSPAMPGLLDAARQAAGRAARGSYGAKLALLGADGLPMLAHPGTQAAVQQFLSEGAGAAGERRDAMLRSVHPLRRDAALHCDACHRVDGSLLDFGSLGYPESRRRTLTTGPIFNMIQHISRGEPFRLPTLTVPVPPESQPAP